MEEMIQEESLDSWLIRFEAKIRSNPIVKFRYAIAIANGNESRIIRLSPPSNYSVEKLSSFNPDFKDLDCAIFIAWSDLKKVLLRTQTLNGLLVGGKLTWQGKTEAALIFHRLILE